MKKPRTPAELPPTLELERILTIEAVALLTGLSPDTIRRRHSHLLRELSPRRVGMKIRDALSIGAKV